MVRALYLALILLITVVVLELFRFPFQEGFASLITAGESAAWTKWMPRRGDIGLDPHAEQGGYTRDIRHVATYADVQRLGQTHDFCRMVHPSTSTGHVNDPELFFACALGGTEGLSSVQFRTPAVKDGFEISRDDYMNDPLHEGRAGYCRILKTGTDHFEAMCNPAGDSGFQAKMITDGSPPPDIQRLLSFYEGIVFWLRFKDDMVDYAKNLTVQTAGSLTIDEVPKSTTRGIAFDGLSQYVRLGDTADMSFGDIVQLRYVRAFSFWVYFDEFTNNAKIFDFGDAGKPSVFCGIIGRGNPTASQGTGAPSCSSLQEGSTVPSAPSGAQCTREVSPQTAMLTSSANVNRWDCPDPEMTGRLMEPLQSMPKTAAGPPQTADLLYEVWDERQRKLHIQVKNVFPLKKWTHVVITATSMDAMKPDVAVYVNGKQEHVERGAWLPQTNYTASNYLGRSNTADATSQYDNRDELFKGRMFDMRGYRTTMTEKKIADTVEWGKGLLEKD